MRTRATTILRPPRTTGVVSASDGDCDCHGNTLDAAGVCGGDCAQDENMNGVCDDIEVEGCTNPTSCNYDPAANVDGGSCEGFPIGFCDCDSTIPDTDNDGVCDEDEVGGTTTHSPAITT